MSKAEPTAGVWAYQRGTVRATREDGLGRNIAEVIYGSTSGATGSFHVTRDDSDANGLLFAASKDLLAACERAMALLNEREPHGWTIDEDTTHTMLEAAIAKAKGGS